MTLVPHIGHHSAVFVIIVELHSCKGSKIYYSKIYSVAMIPRVIIDHNQYIISWVLYPLGLKSIDHSTMKEFRLTCVIPLSVVSINLKFKIIPQSIEIRLQN